MACTIGLSDGTRLMPEQGVPNIDRRASGPEPVRRPVPQAVNNLSGGGDAAIAQEPIAVFSTRRVGLQQTTVR